MMMEFLKQLRSREGDTQYKKERWITLKEAQVIYDLIATNDIDSYYECGTANGFSTCWAILALQSKVCCHGVHTWDLHDRPKVWEMPPLTNIRHSVNFHHEKYNDSLARWVETDRGRNALFFIDGDHRMRSARNDIKNTLLVAKPGDMILLHDITAYEWLNGRFREFEKTHKTQFCDTERGMGVVWVE